MKNKVLEAEFGGEGPRQILGEIMKQADRFRSIMIIGIEEKGETEVWANAMTKKDLALISAKVQGYALVVINDWDSSEE